MGIRIIFSLLLATSMLSACGGSGGSNGKDSGSGNQVGAQRVISNVSITGAAFEEGSTGGNTPLNFNLTLDKPNPDDVALGYAITDVNTEPTDLDHSSGTLTIPAGATSATLTIDVIADTVVEYDEEFMVELINPSANAVIDVGTANGRIINDDLLSMTMDIVGVQEIDDTVSGPRISLDLVLILDLFSLLDGLDLNEILLHLDLYIQNSDQHVAVNIFTGTITVTGVVGGPTGISLNVEVPPTYAGVSLGNLIGKVEIRNQLDEPIPGLSIINMTTQLEEQDIAPSTPLIRVVDGLVSSEGAAGTSSEMVFNAIIDQPVGTDVVIGYETLDFSALASEDYRSETGRLTIPAGQTTGQFSVTVNGDNLPESTEGFIVLLTHDAGTGVLLDTRAIGTIRDDDIPANYGVVSVFDAELVEGDTGTASPMLFTAELDRTVVNDVTLRYATAPNSATSPEDYQAASATLTIPTGQTQGQFAITIQGDSQSEGPENFDLLLWIDSGDAVLQSPFAQGRIIDDDLPPHTPFVAVNNRFLSVEGDAGDHREMVFTAYLDQAVAEDVVISYSTQDDTATSPQDYQSASGAFTIPAGQTSAQFSITINGDDEVEDTQSFDVLLVLESASAIVIDTRATGFIYDDDLPTIAYSIAVGDADLIEGDSGSQDMVFTVTLNPSAQTAIDFDYGTEDDVSFFEHAALATEDYTVVSGSRSFQVGESQLTISVPIRGDTTPEYDENFFLRITGASTVAGANASFTFIGGIGGILSDDPLADVSIADMAMAEGADGETTLFPFTVSLTTALDQSLVLDYITEDVTATGGIDYTTANASITIPAGDTSATIEIPVTGDPAPENDELFRVVLSTASTDAALVKGSAQGVILNDDGAGGWSGMETVFRSGTLGFSIQPQYPQVAFGPGGERQVLFKRRTSVWSSTSSAPGVWTAPLEIGQVENASRPAPSLFIDNNGTGVALWTDPNVVSGSYTPGSGWQDEPLPQTVETTQPIRLAGNPVTGEAVAVWSEAWFDSSDGFDNIWYARYVPGSGWQDMGLVETTDLTADSPSLALPPNGEAIVVFRQIPITNGKFDIVAYQWVNNAWQGPITLDNVDGKDAFAPRIDINASGDAAVVWQQVEPISAKSSIYLNRYDSGGGGWQGAELVEFDDDHPANDPRVAIDTNGNVFVIWEQLSPGSAGSYDLMANRYDVAGNNWSGAQLLELLDIHNDDFYDQQIVADDFGNAIAVWSQKDGTVNNLGDYMYSLRTARYSIADGGWGLAEPLEPIDGYGPGASHLVMDHASGNAMVVWYQYSNFSMDILANRFTAP